MELGWTHRLARASDDLGEGLLNYPVWGYLGWNDIRQRYRRSALGPFWLTISAGVIVAGVGLLYGILFNQPLKEFLPWFAVSYVTWIYVSVSLTEASYAIISAENFVQQTNLPVTIYVVRVVWRNLIILAHNLLVAVVALTLGSATLTTSTVLFVPGLALLTLFLLGVAIILAVVCTRYRDLPMLVTNAIQFLFYVTPILWTEKIIPDRYRWVVEFNPLFHFFELVRAPAFGRTPEFRHVAISLIVIVVTYVCALLVLGRARHRIAYWL